MKLQHKKLMRIVRFKLFNRIQFFCKSQVYLCDLPSDYLTLTLWLLIKMRVLRIISLEQMPMCGEDSVHEKLANYVVLFDSIDA